MGPDCRFFRLPRLTLSGVKARPNAVLAAAVGVIAVVVFLAAVIATTRSPVRLDPASPEAVVQAYLAAVADADLTEAAGLLASNSTCGIDNLATAYLPPSLQAELVSTSTGDDTALVTVSITEGGEVDLFGSSGYSHAERFLLTLETGGWRLTGSPWPMYECDGPVR